MYLSIYNYFETYDTRLILNHFAQKLGLNLTFLLKYKILNTPIKIRGFSVLNSNISEILLIC